MASRGRAQRGSPHATTTCEMSNPSQQASQILAAQSRDTKMYSFCLLPFLFMVSLPTYRAIISQHPNKTSQWTTSQWRCQFGGWDAWKCLITLLRESSRNSSQPCRVTPYEPSCPKSHYKEITQGISTYLCTTSVSRMNKLKGGFFVERASGWGIRMPYTLSAHKDICPLVWFVFYEK